MNESEDYYALDSLSALDPGDCHAPGWAQLPNWDSI